MRPWPRAWVPREPCMNPRDRNNHSVILTTAYVLIFLHEPPRPWWKDLASFVRYVVVTTKFLWWVVKHLT